MGATIFFLLMMGLFFMAVAAVALGIFLGVTRCNKKIAVAAIAVGCIIALLPVGFIVFLRYQNGQPEAGYVDTGVMVEWQGETFTYQDEKYVPLYDEADEDVFIYSPAVDENGREVAFNIKPKPDFWSIVFNANYAENVYKIDSEEGTTLYYNYYVFCPENKKAQIRQYYETDRKWSIVTNLFSDDEYEIPIELTVDEEYFLDNINNVKQIKMNTSEIKMEADLKFTTSDEVIEGITGLYSDGEKWYWDTDEVEENSSDEEIVYIVCELPESLSEKITQTVTAID